MSIKARIFFSLVCLAGLVAMLYGAWSFHVTNPPMFLSYLAISLLASRLKVKLPEINGTVSVNFLFILIGTVELSFSETLLIGCAAVLTQCFNEKGRRLPKIEHVVFNVCCSSFAVWGGYYVYHGPLRWAMPGTAPLLLLFAACIYFLFNTVPVATIISLTEYKSLAKIWKECYFWSFPYYLTGAAIAGMVSWVDARANWQTSLLAFPAMFVIYRSYRLYLSKLENEKRHVEEMAALHLRTIEALALAIEAKDQSTHDHLRRVRVYAVEVGARLNLSEDEMAALRAAALLHDIGKLAVPEHILSKPGRLTKEEFDKVKIHPVVGAEILERVQFPYPVAAVVRSHHEKWDGSGYPDGLKGEEIPIGARILSAVDCFDALASTRSYRAALPLQEAMKHVAAESGKSFDPRVVALLGQSYVELDEIVRSQSGSLEWQKLSHNLKVERGLAPAAGLEREKTSHQPFRRATFLSSIAAARQEVQTLFELSHDLGNSLSLDETLSMLSTRLKRLVPHDTMVAFILRGDELVPEYASGECAGVLAAVRVPLGQGTSGWVAQNRQGIVNGNPSQEPGYVRDPSGCEVRSTISVPLEGVHGVVGVLTLYHTEKDVYTGDHLRILTAVSSKVALSVENALAFRQAENFATTDYLTGLPNARSLFLHLDREIGRCKRLDTSLTLMICDLNGFKQVNDRFGHLEGNRILRLFAKALQNCCRDYDYPARMGGDEFVVVAPGLSLSAAESRGAKLDELAIAIGREVCGEDVLSLSMGCAVYPQDGSDAEKLLAEADRHMYRAKERHHSARASVDKLFLVAPPTESQRSVSQ